MAELRYDSISGRIVVIPNNGNKSSNEGCPYCLGNTNSNHPVLALVKEGNMIKRVYDSEVDDWCVCVFASKDPIVTQNNDLTYTDKPFVREPAYGYHYVIALSSTHENPCKLPVEQWANIFVALQDRLRWLYSQKRVIYVLTYMSNLNGIHPHINMVTLPSIPPLIEKESSAINIYINENGSCPICDMVKNEYNGPRYVFATNYFIAVCPWASTHSYEFSIIPKKHHLNFTKITQKEINELALIVRITLGALTNVLGNDEFNMVFHIPSEKQQNKQFHWHIDVYPNINESSILANEFGIYINRLKPEESALKLAQACRKEFAELMGVK